MSGHQLPSDSQLRQSEGKMASTEKVGVSQPESNEYQSHPGGTGRDISIL